MASKTKAELLAEAQAKGLNVNETMTNEELQNALDAATPAEDSGEATKIDVTDGDAPADADVQPDAPADEPEAPSEPEAPAEDVQPDEPEEEAEAPSEPTAPFTGDVSKPEHGNL